ncbi:MAG: M48 family metalloprotease [Luteolibacter sp.]
MIFDYSALNGSVEWVKDTDFNTKATQTVADIHYEMTDRPKNNRNVRGGLGCLFFTLAPLIAGLQGVYTLATSSHSPTLTIQEYFEKQPRNSDLTLKDCTLDLLRATPRRGILSGELQEICIPLFEKTPSPKDKARFVWRTRSHKYRLAYLEAQKHIADKAYIDSNPIEFYPVETVSGQIAWGINREDGIRTQITAAGYKWKHPPQAYDFLLLCEDGDEGLGWTYFLLATCIGLAGIYISSRLLVGKLELAAANPAAANPAAANPAAANLATAVGADLKSERPPLQLQIASPGKRSNTLWKILILGICFGLPIFFRHYWWLLASPIAALVMAYGIGFLQRVFSDERLSSYARVVATLVLVPFGYICVFACAFTPLIILGLFGLFFVTINEASGGPPPLMGVWLALIIGGLIATFASLFAICASFRSDAGGRQGLLISPEREKDFLELIAKEFGRAAVAPPRSVVLSPDPIILVRHRRTRLRDTVAKGPVLVVGLPLLHILSESELRCILLHEVAHVLRRHTLYASIVARAWVVLRVTEDRLKRQIRVKHWINDLVKISLYLPLGMIVIMRRLFYRLNRANLFEMEFEADRFAARLGGEAMYRGALTKLAGFTDFYYECLQAHLNEVLSSEGYVRNYFELFSAVFEPALRERRDELQVEALHATASTAGHPPMSCRLAKLSSEHLFAAEIDQIATSLLKNLSAYELELTEQIYEPIG